VERPVSSKPFYKIVEHTADIGVEVVSPDRNGVFTAAALAMFDIMFGLDTIDQKDRRRVSVSGDGPEELLVAWLNELLYVYAVEKLVFSGIAEADLRDTSFSALALGEALDPGRHRVEVEIKAATYHEVMLRQKGGRWTARVIFDI
jgi:SHS2 domain-containing protein